VYEVFDLWEKKKITLKIHSPEGESEKSSLPKFKEEFRLTTELSHPGVVEAYDFGYAENKKAFYTMELIVGEELSAKVAQPDLDRFYRVVWQIFDILEYLQSQNVIHADLKPSNFKLTSDVFSVKIMDFGLARKSTSLTFNQTAGTPIYMAPEIWLREKIDQRTDLYSLGVILYELLTSKPPFSSDDPLILRSHHLEKTPDPLSTLRTGLPEKLEAVVMKLLQKKPEDRFQNIYELKEEFSKITSYPLRETERTSYLNLLYGGKMLARTKEYQNIQNELKNSLSSGGKMFLIDGEFGIGKSALLNHLKKESQLEGIFFVQIDCPEEETHPLQPLKELFGKMWTFFQVFSPGLCQKYQETFRLFLNKGESQENLELEKLYSFLLEASNLLPFVIAFENLHWMSEGNLSFLKELTEKLENSRIFLCGTFEEAKLDPGGQLKSLINHLIGTKKLCLLRLPAFSMEQLQELLSQKLGADINSFALRDFVYQNSSGIPLFAVEILKHLFEKKVLFFEKGMVKLEVKKLSGFTIPDSIEKTILGNLTRYPGDILNFLNLASLIGKEFDLESMKFISGYEEEKIFEALFLLLKDRFLFQSKISSSHLIYNFTSPAYQSMIYKNIPGDKKVLHRKLAYFLEERKSWGEEIETETIAYHYILSNDYSKAFDYSLQCSVINQKDLDYPQALKYLKHALEAANKFPLKKEKEKRKSQALMQRGDLLKTIGELNQAQKDYEELVKTAEFLEDKNLLAETYKNLGDLYRIKHNHKKGLECLLKSKKIFEELKDDIKLSNTLNNIGNIYWIDSQHQKALEAFGKALEIQKTLNNNSDIASTLNNMGTIYVSQHQYKKALECHNNSLQIKKEMGNKEEIARSLNNIGFVYNLIGDYQKAISSFWESLKLNQEIENKKEIAINTVNLGESYFKLGEYEEVARYAKWGLELCREINFQLPVGYLLRNLAVVDQETGQYQKALVQLKEALKCSEEIGDKELKVLVLVSLGRLFLLINRDEIAVEYLDKALETANIINDKKSLIAVGKLKGLYFEKNKKTTEALCSLESSMSLADELNSPEDKLCLSLKIAQFYMNSNQKLMPENNLDKAKMIIDQGCFPLFEPEYYFLLSYKEFHTGNLSQALKYSESSLNKASKLNQLELIWRAHYLKGKINFSKDNLEEAFREFEKAGKIIKILSQNIEDSESKRSYLTDKEKQKLLSDLKHLTRLMVGR